MLQVHMLSSVYLAILVWNTSLVRCIGEDPADHGLYNNPGSAAAKSVEAWVSGRPKRPFIKVEHRGRAFGKFEALEKRSDSGHESVYSNDSPEDASFNSKKAFPATTSGGSSPSKSRGTERELGQTKGEGSEREPSPSKGERTERHPSEGTDKQTERQSSQGQGKEGQREPSPSKDLTRQPSDQSIPYALSSNTLQYNPQALPQPQPPHPLAMPSTFTPFSRQELHGGGLPQAYHLHAPGGVIGGIPLLGPHFSTHLIPAQERQPQHPLLVPGGVGGSEYFRQLSIPGEHGVPTHPPPMLGPSAPMHVSGALQSQMQAQFPPYPSLHAVGSHQSLTLLHGQFPSGQILQSFGSGHAHPLLRPQLPSVPNLQAMGSFPGHHLVYGQSPPQLQPPPMGPILGHPLLHGGMPLVQNLQSFGSIPGHPPIRGRLPSQPSLHPFGSHPGHFGSQWNLQNWEQQKLQQEAAEREARKLTFHDPRHDSMRMREPRAYITVGSMRYDRMPKAKKPLASGAPTEESRFTYIVQNLQGDIALAVVGDQGGKLQRMVGCIDRVHHRVAMGKVQVASWLHAKAFLFVPRAGNAESDLSSLTHNCLNDIEATLRRQHVTQFKVVPYVIPRKGGGGFHNTMTVYPSSGVWFNQKRVSSSSN